MAGLSSVGRFRADRHGGFATLIAITLIAMIAAALVAMASQIRHEIVDSRQEKVRAELRQMLLAGGAASPSLVVGNRETLDVDLPTPLRARGGSLELRRLAGNREFEQWIEIIARLEGVTARQSVKYIRGPDGWGMADARLLDVASPTSDQAPDDR